MLDNAIEASQPNKDVEVYILSYEKNLIIQVRNYFLETIDIMNLFKKDYSSKKDNFLHGYGLSNLRKLVQKRKGILNIKKKESIITFTAEFFDKNMVKKKF